MRAPVGSMLVPKYGPAAAGTPQNRAEKPPGQGPFGSYPREVTQFATIHTGAWAGRDIVSHGTVIRSNTFSAAWAPSESLPFRSRGLGMGEDILGRPAGEIEPDPVGQEAKAGFGEFR